VPVVGVRFLGELISIDAQQQVSFRVGGKSEPIVVPLSNLVRWGNPLPPRAQTIVVLADGGRLVTAADWSGGTAVQLKQNQFEVLSDTWGTISIDGPMVRGIVFAQRERAEKRERLVASLTARDSATNDVAKTNARESDIVMLTNGDRLRGEITSIERGSVTLKTPTGETKLPLSRVEMMQFAETSPNTGAVENGKNRQSSAASQLTTVLLGTRDGSLLHARSVEASPKEVSLQLSNGVTLAGGSVDEIVALQVFSPKWVYLSDLPGADYRFVPYLSLSWPLTIDHSVTDAPLSVGGKRYLKGLGLHSAARVTYKLDGPYQRFEALAAIDDEANERGSAVFGVYAERNGKWSEAFQSETIRGGEAPRPISVDLRGATGLTLTVDYADRGDELDYCDWLDARLVR
jgi:NPCBM/NEW2 domain